MVFEHAKVVLFKGFNRNKFTEWVFLDFLFNVGHDKVIIMEKEFAQRIRVRMN